MTLARSLDKIGVDQVSTMSPFDLFKSQLESSVEAKVDAMKRLKVVCLAAGLQQTQSVIIPYVTTNIANKQPPHEDELLLELAVQLKLVVGTSVCSGDEQCLPLLPILERLMTMEETVVRDAAVDCLNTAVLPQFSHTESFQQVLNLTKRLANADWFTSKVSAAGVLPAVLKYSTGKLGDSALVELKFLMRDLCVDDTPMVRRAASKSIGQFLNLLKKQSDVEELLVNMQSLCSDEQDSVRLLAVASLKDFQSYSEQPDWTSQNLLPLLKAGSTDASW
jgi:serine/threonine-protein phosphatase 2A regulatory subunit A